VKQDLVEIEVIIRNRICGICSDRTASGDCGLSEPAHCALFRLFPEVARAIQSVHSDDIQPYIDAIRHNVCSICAEQDAAGDCESRQQVRCALDAYLLPVVEAIEEATGRMFDKKNLGLPGGSAPVVSGPQIRL
jgi:hypothetical protein